MRRVMVIGLDCAPPALVFGHLRAALPNLTALADRGAFGRLRSSEPPITVPAWTCMTSGRDPGELGLYGFRNRVEGSYDLALATSRDVTVKRVWDRLGEAGRRVAVLFVPLTWPPPPVRGDLVSCFLWPGGDAPYTFPRGLAAELEGRFGPYRADVTDFRSEETERVLRELHESTAQHFAMAEHLWRARRPDFLMMVEMGTDRLHHAAWPHLDPEDPRHDPAHPLVAAARDYYRALDAHVGRMVEAAGPDTTVLVVSDHGARSMRGGVRVNELLRREGWLTLDREPGASVPLREAHVDWARTRAWGEGGYYARVFLNVRGREPQGTVDPSRYDVEREALARLLRDLPGPDGRPLGTRVRRPEEAYRHVRGRAPDLLVYFGDLAYRSLGTVGGHEGVFTATNDTGPDGCNHDWDGILLGAGPGLAARGEVEGLGITDVAPLVLGLAGVAGVEPPPPRVTALLA